VTSQERADRNHDVVSARARGLSWTEISRRFNITDRQCRRVVAEYRESGPRLHQIDPIETIEDALDHYDSVIEDMAILAESTSHDGTKLGALKGRLEAVRGKLDLMEAVGILPRDLGRLRFEIDVRRFAASVLDVFAQHDVPHGVQKAVIEAIESRQPKLTACLPVSQNGSNP
jgi:hypothetical protein